MIAKLTHNPSIRSCPRHPIAAQNTLFFLYKFNVWCAQTWKHMRGAVNTQTWVHVWGECTQIQYTDKQTYSNTSAHTQLPLFLSCSISWHFSILSKLLWCRKISAVILRYVVFTTILHNSINFRKQQSLPFRNKRAFPCKFSSSGNSLHFQVLLGIVYPPCVCLRIACSILAGGSRLVLFNRASREHM